MKTTFKKGDIISVHQGVSYLNRTPSRKLKEYEITSLNGSSIYAKPIGHQYDSSVRFDRKTLKSKATMVQERLTIIVDVDAFHAEWDKKERVEELKLSIQELLKNNDEEDVLTEIKSLLEQ